MKNILLVVAMLEAALSWAADPAPLVPWPPPDTSVSWQDPQARASTPAVTLRVLTFNDFHGNLQTPAPPDGRRPAGGAAVLAAYLHVQRSHDPAGTLIIHAGDLLGASPPITRLLQNEPAIQFLNLLAGEQCRYGAATHFYSAASWREQPDPCPVIGTPGNHEFDAGPEELLRLLNGGNANGGPFLQNPWRGSRVPYVCANVLDRRTGRTLLPPYAVVVIHGVPVGVIGAVLKETPTLVPAWATANLQFTDEAAAINAAARELQAHGVHTLLVTIHQGVVPTATDRGFAWHGPLLRIVSQLDPGIDVVISGHTHNFTNALWPDHAGHPVLVVQDFSYGMAFGELTLKLDPASGRVISKSARVLPAWADAGPGLHPDAAVAQLTRQAVAAVGPRLARVVAHSDLALTRSMSPAGESVLGDLIADAQRAAVQADVGLMNPGGLRADLSAGNITWGDILTVHPFGNRILLLQMTGAQLRQTLEQQWSADPAAIPRILKTSGLYYQWDPQRPAGAHVVRACDAHHQPLRATALYRVAVNDFLVGGGDDFKSFGGLPVVRIGPLDTEALESYLASMHGQITAPAGPRIFVTGGAPLQCGGTSPQPTSSP
ncbi:MAG TPA: bifunctional metallophosphatase/5'-nucleotidase [Steroidobacteraceae bacterium]|nr:bifunctional metallophosphatase/5'-nucleotidase [Steroidobacteraceae bacterium]